MFVQGNWTRGGEATQGRQGEGRSHLEVSAQGMEAQLDHARWDQACLTSFTSRGWWRGVKELMNPSRLQRLRSLRPRESPPTLLCMYGCAAHTRGL